MVYHNSQCNLLNSSDSAEISINRLRLFFSYSSVFFNSECTRNLICNWSNIYRKKKNKWKGIIIY